MGISVIQRYGYRRFRAGGWARQKHICRAAESEMSSQSSQVTPIHGRRGTATYALPSSFQIHQQRQRWWYEKATVEACRTWTGGKLSTGRSLKPRAHLIASVWGRSSRDTIQSCPISTDRLRGTRMKDPHMYHVVFSSSHKHACNQI